MIYNEGMEKGYLTHLNNLDAEASGLLGSFDANNQYIIDDGIIKELLVSNKLIESYENDIITATATVGEYKLDFSVYIQDGENNQKRAGLFVIEKCKLGFANNVKTLVDSFVADNTPNFYFDLKKRFHLYALDESEGIDMKNSNLTKIINKKSGNINRYKTYIPLMYDADREYVKKMLALIKSSDKYGQDFLIKLRQMIEDKNLVKTSPNYWREVRILLDKMLMQNVAVFGQDILKKMEGIQKEYLDVLSKTKEPEKAQSKQKSKKETKKFSFDGVKPESVTMQKVDYTPEKPKPRETTKPKEKVTLTVETYTYTKTVKTKEPEGVADFSMFGSDIKNGTFERTETISATVIKCSPCSDKTKSKDDGRDM